MTSVSGQWKIYHIGTKIFYKQFISFGLITSIYPQIAVYTEFESNLTFTRLLIDTLDLGHKYKNLQGSEL